MTKGLVLRGVPRRILQDGWWLTTTTENGNARRIQADGTIREQAKTWWPFPVALTLLLVLGDFLFWQQPAGLSVAIFAMAVLWAAGIGRPIRARVISGAVFILSAAPVVDYLQALSLAFLAVGLIVGLAILHAPAERFKERAQRIAGFVLTLPRAWLRMLDPTRITVHHSSGARWQWLRDWAFPIGGTLVFLSLLIEANPVFLRLGTNLLDPWSLMIRALFWVGTAVLIAPLLMSEPWQRDVHSLSLKPRFPGLGLNPRSVLRALVMFNVLIGVQMIADASIVIGGASLPEGMSYAEYAHRGSYPLLGTAMLAGAFALAARPFWREHSLIRPLMLLWLLQNVVLTGAAALRLDLYVEAYGITYLRLYAFIWMALVAIGLVMMLWQVLLDRSTRWLVVRLSVLGLVTLYLCSFVNFAGTVATINLKRADPHVAYICGLGPMASGAVHKTLRARPDLVDDFGYYGVYACAATHKPRIDGWRDWGFRQWRVIHTVEATK